MDEPGLSKSDILVRIANVPFCALVF
jgi:hypothetical protein